MPVSNIIQYLSDKKAAKRPSWGGYVRRDNTIGTDGTLVSYKVTIVQRDGDQFIFQHNETSGAWSYVGFIAHGSGGSLGTGSPVVGTTLPLGCELFDSLFIATDWIQGYAEDFETARTGNGEY